MAADLSLPRLIAFYLPQFHPIPENDAWWGEGFTEWTNVRKGRPLFPGHWQPHVPADEVGHYDLRDAAVRDRQAVMAREHGISAFCYYHYWFQGRRLLERPFQEVLASDRPDFPFCLCWANENWTRAWDGQQRQVLMPQSYDEQDHLAHIRVLLPAFEDARYLRHDGKPVFLVYRASEIPDTKGMTTLWRRIAAEAGLPGLYLLRVESSVAEATDPRAMGFDAAVDFQPAWRDLARPDNFLLRHFAKLLRIRLPARFGYAGIARAMARRPAPAWPRMPGLTPMWDNTARRGGRGVVLHGSTPDLYREWLESSLAQARDRQAPFVFVNAWNEWGEGCHLEPDARWGHAYLEATRSALLALPAGGMPTQAGARRRPAESCADASTSAPPPR